MKKFMIVSFMLSAMIAAKAQTATKEEQEVRNLPRILETGWNNKSGEEFASVFADVHDYVVVNGMYFSNFTRKQNAANHQRLFETTFKTMQLRLVVDKVNFVRTDLAMINAIGGLYEKGTSPGKDPAVIMTILAEKKAEGWKIISFHNHSLNDVSSNSPVPMNVMYASWYK